MINVLETSHFSWNIHQNLPLIDLRHKNHVKMKKDKCNNNTRKKERSESGAESTKRKDWNRRLDLMDSALGQYVLANTENTHKASCRPVWNKHIKIKLNRLHVSSPTSWGNKCRMFKKTGATCLSIWFWRTVCVPVNELTGAQNSLFCHCSILMVQTTLWSQHYMK